MVQSVKTLKSGAITDIISTSLASYATPKISTISYVGNDTAADIAGGQTITLTGSGFASGAIVLINNQTVGVVSVVNSTTITFISPALSAGSYILYVVNTDGGTGISIPGIQYSGTPAWSTTAGSLSTQYETTAYTSTVVAAGDAPVTYSLVSGTLPPGATLNSNGTLTGTSAVGPGSPTTYTFTIAASDTQNQDTNRQFSITINPDVITWSSPANATVITSYEYSNIANVTLSASSIVGDTVNYSGTNLPAGISISGANIIGTSNTVANTTATITAIGNTTTRTSSETIYFNVQQDVVTWSNPSGNATITLDGTAYSNTLSATSAAGKTVNYAANTLPSGLTLTSGTISGTPTVDGTITTALTATATTTNRTATNTITWVVTLGDTFWKNVSLLLSGATPTTTFINDSSLNNNQLTLVGDTKPNSFNPYGGSYYSNYFDGSGDALTIANNAAFDFGSGNWTIEFWINTTSSVEQHVYSKRTSTGVYSPVIVGINTNKLYILGSTTGSSWNINSGFAVGTISFPSGVWAHIAVVRNGTTVTGYVNGVADVTYTGISGAMMTNTTDVTVGSGTTAVDNPVFGYVSNLRVIKGTALYTSAFTPGTTPLTAISGTQLLTCQSNRLIDNSVNNLAIVKNGDTTVSPATPFVTPTTSSYNTQYSTYFDGTGDAITVPTNIAFAPSTSDFTVEAWFYPLSLSGGFQAVFAVSATNGLFFGGLSGNVFGLRSAGVANLISTSPPAINQWTHMAASRQGTSLRLFINGTLVNTVTDSTNFAQGYGCSGADQNGNFPFNGYVSNVRLVKGTALYTTSFTPSTIPLTTSSQGATPSQVSLLTCQDATLKDNSTNNLTITSYNQAQPIAVSPFTMTTSNTPVTNLGSAYFDGTGDYLTAPASVTSTLSGTWTVEAWCYMTVAPTGNTYATSFPILTSEDNAGTMYHYWGIGSTAFVGMTRAGTGYETITGTMPAANQWFHVAVTNVGTLVKVYINGVLVGSLTQTAGTWNATGIITRIGALYTYNYANGYISNLRVINGTELYTSNFLPPQAPLTPVTNTQLLTLQYNGGATNNSFVDQSSFNNIITRNGNATQGTFSPFSQNGWSTYFNGSAYMTIANNTVFDFGTGDFTIECWVNPQTFAPGGGGTSSNNYIASALPSSGTISGWYFGYGPTGDVFMGAWVSGTNQRAYTSEVVLTVGKWSHIAYTRTGGVNKIFVDGVSRTLGGTLTQATDTGGNALHLGAMLYDAYYNYPTANISNFRIVKGTSLYTSNFAPSTTPLTPVPNTSLLTCQSNRLHDIGAYNHTITPSGTPSVQAFSPFGGVTSVPTSYSNYFGAQNTYIRTANNTNTVPGTGDFTIEGWFFFTASVANNQAMFNLGAYDNGILIRGYNSGFDVWINNTQIYNVVGSGSYTINAWYHIALTRQGTNLRLFLNGTQLGSTATNSMNITASGAPNYLLGTSAHAASSDNTIGYLSNWRVIRGQSLYNGSFTPSTSPLTKTTVGSTGAGAVASITGTVELLTLQNNTIIDNSYNNATITVTGTVLPRPFNPFGITTTTNVSYTPAVNGGSMYFDGTGDYLTGTNDVSCSGNFTLQWWVYKLTSSATDIFKFGSESTGRVSIGIDSSNNLFYNIFGVSNINFGTVGNNAWHHIAMVRNGSTITGYINGVSSGTSTSSVTFGNNGGFTICAYHNGYTSDLQLIKGTALYTANFYPGSAPATPTTQIGTTTYASSLLLNGTSGGIIDYHGTNNLETVGNTQLASEDPYGGSYYSNYFEGPSYYVNVATTTALGFGTGAFTIEFWFKGPTPTDRFICCFRDGTNAGYPHIKVSAAGKLSFASESLDSTTSINDGNWHHCAITRLSSTIKVWVDGVQENSTTFGPSNYGASNPVRIGRDSYGGNGVTGYISNFRVVKGTALYTSNFTPSTTPLTAVSGTSLLTCQSNRFIDNSTNALVITVNVGITNGITTPAVKSINPFQRNTGKSIYFDGTGDYLFGNNTQFQLGMGTSTIEFWMYLTSYGDPTSAGGVLFNGVSSADSPRYQMGWTTSGIFNVHYQSTTASQDVNTASGIVKLNQWQHYAIVLNGTTHTTYVDGVSQATATITVTSPAAGNNLYIGFFRNDAALRYMTGYIKDLRVTKGIARYTTTFTPPATPLNIK